MLPHPEVTPVIAPVFHLKAGVGTGGVLCGQKEEPEEPLNHKTGEPAHQPPNLVARRVAC